MSRLTDWIEAPAARRKIIAEPKEIAIEEVGKHGKFNHKLAGRIN